MAIGLIDYYGTGNASQYTIIRNEHPSSDGYMSAIGQALTLSTAKTITSIKFYLLRIGSPTGNLIVNIYAATGTVGTDAKPTGATLGLSNVINSGGVGLNLALYEFTFSTPVNLSAGDYCFSLEANSSNFDSSNYIDVGIDDTSPTHAGNGFHYHNSAWSETSNDKIFYLYGY